MILSPKQRFQQTPDAKTHADLAVSNSFQNAVTAALAQLVMDMPGGGNPAQSWDAHNQVVGARKFIDALLNLAEPPTPAPPKTLRANLTTDNAKPKTYPSHD
jgi:hypothetical protein